VTVLKVKTTKGGLVRAAVIGLVLSFVLTSCVGFRLTTIHGKSMLPTIGDGAILVTLYGDMSPERGDLVSIWGPEEGNDRAWLKRVIAVPGDTIEIGTFGVKVNGTLLDEPYAIPEPYYIPRKVTLEDDELWVMGDNRPISLDSRFVGPISLRRILLVHEVWFQIGGDFSGN
jgi:signal peptidase I